MGELATVKSTALATPVSKEVISSIVLHGDLSQLKEHERINYIISLCERLGLDPATNPFKLLKLNGKLTPYADRSCAAQLNKIYSISHTCTARESHGDVYVVTMRASDAKHHTESTGAVSIKGLAGEALANAMMKAETKAKRRSTLDLVGLGILDETEVSSIKGVELIEIETKRNKPDEENNEAEAQRQLNIEHHSEKITLADDLKGLKEAFAEGYNFFKRKGDDKAMAILKAVYEQRKPALTVVVPDTKPEENKRAA